MYIKLRRGPNQKVHLYQQNTGASLPRVWCDNTVIHMYICPESFIIVYDTARARVNNIVFVSWKSQSFFQWFYFLRSLIVIFFSFRIHLCNAFLFANTMIIIIYFYYYIYFCCCHCFKEIMMHTKEILKYFQPFFPGKIFAYLFYFF